MPKSITMLRIFAASPSDVKEEREILEEIVRELNLTWREQLGLVLELVKWETHASPGISTDAQAVINEQIADDYDIFVGMLWTRFGTATTRAASGTEEEFERAFAKWKARPDDIRILIYFKTTPITPDQIDTDQLTRVHAFRKGLEDKGVLYWSYATLEEFTSFLRVHLSRQVQEWSKTWGNAAPPQLNLGEPTPFMKSPDPAAVLEEEEGYFDLIERTVIEFARAGEVITHLGQALNDLSTKVAEATEDLNAVTGDQRTKLTAYKRLSNRVADVMSDFTARMKPDIPILRASLYGALDAYGRTASMMLDFGVDSSVLGMLHDALVTIIILENAIVSSQQNITSLRRSTAGLPRLTQQFNRAKREILEVLDDYLATIERALNLVPEIRISITDILKSANSESGNEASFC